MPQYNYKNKDSHYKFKFENVKWSASLPCMIYGSLLASTIGHELGHAAIPYFYGEKVNIRIRLSTGGSMSYTTNYLPQKLSPVISALGPLTGVATSLGVLKASNIFFEINKKYSEHDSDKTLMQAVTLGIQKPLVNSDQSPSLVLSTLYACNGDAVQFYNCRYFYKSLNYLGFKKFEIPYSDGQHICDHFSLSKPKAFLLRNAMAAATFGLAWQALGLFQSNKRDNNKFYVDDESSYLETIKKRFQRGN